jgi:hypothetical protein
MSARQAPASKTTFAVRFALSEKPPRRHTLEAFDQTCSDGVLRDVVRPETCCWSCSSATTRLRPIRTEPKVSSLIRP